MIITAKYRPTTGNGRPSIRRGLLCLSLTSNEDNTKNFIRIVSYILVIAFMGFIVGERYVSFSENTKVWVPSQINYMERECPVPSYDVVGNKTYYDPSTICITTLTDSALKSGFLYRMIRWRNFDNLLEMTWPNKQQYCNKHGYQLFNESPSVDPDRPPSWSKIRAVQRLLREEQCEWVFWLDADTVIMNSNKRIEDILPTPETGIDLILTEQKGNSWNAGAWMIRNTNWSNTFLNEWWNMKEFVKPKGLAVSGDNDALKSFLTNMDTKMYHQHIAVPARCNFNSDARWNTPEEIQMFTPNNIAHPKFYMNTGSYHKGDFIAHVAGTSFRLCFASSILRLFPLKW
jgi:galactosyl transferase GMA12/MNN10 family